MAGKVISQRNSSDLKGAFASLGKVLIASGVTKQEVLELLELPDDSVTVIQAAAKSILEQVTDSTWREGVEKICGILRQNFCSCWWYEDKSRQEKQEILTELLEGIEVALADFFARLPEPNHEEGKMIYAQAEELAAAQMSLKDKFAVRIWREKVYCAVETLGDCIWHTVFYPSSEESDRAAICAQHWQEAKEILQQCIAEMPEDEALYASGGSTVGEELSGPVDSVVEGEDSEVVTSELQASASVTIAGAIQFDQLQAGSNEQPFSGVLLRIDEASETAPQVGPQYPLYVPMIVAEELMVAINASGALPLDISPDLNQHFDGNITGVMTSAEILGQDFIVHGHLFDHNKPETIQEIRANQQELGMSINGSISYKTAEIDNQQVAVAQSLTAKGAAILKSEKATWQKTRVLQASGLENPNTTHGEQKMADGLTLEQLQASLQQAIAPLNDRMANMEGRLQAQGSELETIKAQAAQEQAKVQAAQEAKEAAQAQENLVAAFSKALDEKLTPLVEAQNKKTVQRAMNPNLSPISLTQGQQMNLAPLAAGAGDAFNPELHELQLQASSIQGRLEEMARTNDTSPLRIELKDKLGQITRQMSSLAN